MRKWLAILMGKIQASNEPSPWPKIAPVAPASVKGTRGWAGLEMTSGLEGSGKVGDGCKGWAGRRVVRHRRPMQQHNTSTRMSTRHAWTRAPHGLKAIKE